MDMGIHKLIEELFPAPRAPWEYSGALEGFDRARTYEGDYKAALKERMAFVQGAAALFFLTRPPSITVSKERWEEFQRDTK
jgi:hypothetical protein